MDGQAIPIWRGLQSGPGIRDDDTRVFPVHMHVVLLVAHALVHTLWNREIRACACRGHVNVGVIVPRPALSFAQGLPECIIVRELPPSRTHESGAEQIPVGAVREDVE